jgi:hypothetical protein
MRLTKGMMEISEELNSYMNMLIDFKEWLNTTESKELMASQLETAETHLEEIWKILKQKKFERRRHLAGEQND